MNQKQSNTICNSCSRIACKECDWVASDEEVKFIQEQTLTSCPKCGWKPPPRHSRAGGNTAPQSLSMSYSSLVSEREILKKDKLEYLYKCSTPFVKYSLLGSAIRALGKGWGVNVFSSRKNIKQYRLLGNLLKDPSFLRVITSHLIDPRLKSHRPELVSGSYQEQEKMLKQVQHDGSKAENFDLTLIESGTTFKPKVLRDEILGKTHIMVSGKDKNTDDYDLISNFTIKKLNKSGVIAITGNGKGKSTTAFGIALEEVIKGEKAAVVQWFKEPKGPRGTWSINEHYFPELLKNKDSFQFYPTGAGFYSSPKWDRLKGENAYSIHSLAAQKGIKIAKELISSGEYKVIVLDEFVDTLKEVSKNISKSLLNITDVHGLLIYAGKYPKTKIVVTGRRVTPEWEDYIKDSIVIAEIRHPWSSRQKFALSGLDF